MSQTALTKLGSIRLPEVEALSTYAGRDFIPFPFLATEENPHTYAEDYGAFASSVIERYQQGDLQIFAKWARTYESADISSRMPSVVLRGEQAAGADRRAQARSIRLFRDAAARRRGRRIHLVTIRIGTCGRRCDDVDQTRQAS